jgi:uncharacterized membrane protein YqaE (UPF0057 family)
MGARPPPSLPVHTSCSPLGFFPSFGFWDSALVFPHRGLWLARDTVNTVNTQSSFFPGIIHIAPTFRPKNA